MNNFPGPHLSIWIRRDLLLNRSCASLHKKFLTNSKKTDERKPRADRAQILYPALMPHHVAFTLTAHFMLPPHCVLPFMELCGRHQM